MMKYKWVEPDSANFKDVYAVRYAVFVKEQGFSAEGEFDEQDKHSLHLVGYLKDKPVCTGRLFAETEGGGAVWHIGRVAVLPLARGRGAGLAMMGLFAHKAKQMGGTSIVLNAQADKTKFYQRAGYCIIAGGENLDEGVAHVHMRYTL